MYGGVKGGITDALSFRRDFASCLWAQAMHNGAVWKPRVPCVDALLSQDEAARRRSIAAKARGVVVCVLVQWQHLVLPNVFHPRTEATSVCVRAREAEN